MLNKRTYFIFSLTCLVIILASCNMPGTQPAPDSPAASPPTDTPAPPPTATPALGLNDLTYQVQFKITTTSDWTSLRLLSGGDWYNIEVASSSPEAMEAGFSGGFLMLSQGTDRATAGEQIELVAKALLAHMDPAAPLIIEVERGNLGETLVEVSGFREGSPYPITTFTWDGNKSSGPNAQTYELSPQPFLGSNPNEYIVIAQMNFWYFGPYSASTIPRTRMWCINRSNGRWNTVWTHFPLSGTAPKKTAWESRWKGSWTMFS